MKVAINSDHMQGFDPTAPLNPYHRFLAMYIAISRKTESVAVIGAGHRVSREDALRMMTVDAAWLSFDESTSCVAVSSGPWQAERDAWATMSAAQLDEPSGIAPLGKTPPWMSFERWWRPALLVAVDDEEPDVFVLQVLDERLGKYGVLGRERFSSAEFGLKDPLNDLEGLAYDEMTGSHWAVTSHRRGGPRRSGERRLFQFSIDWYSANRTPKVLRYYDLSDQLLSKLEDFALEDWSKEEPTRYALEIEGLAARDGRLTIGLTWPLWKEDAIVLEYDTKLSSLGRARRLALKHRDTAHGVSALTWHGSDLWIGANPPDKLRRESINGASWLFVCRASGALERAEARESGSRLEGLAVMGDRLVLAYEGPRRLIKRWRIADIPLEPHGHCDDVHAEDVHVR